MKKPLFKEIAVSVVPLGSCEIQYNDLHAYLSAERFGRSGLAVRG